MNSATKENIKKFFGKCSICGKNRGLTVHHKFKKRVSFYNIPNKDIIRLYKTNSFDKFYDVLCYNCHQKLHRLECIFEYYQNTMKKIKDKDISGLNKRLIAVIEKRPEDGFERIIKKVLKQINQIHPNLDIKNYFLIENQKFIKTYDNFEKNGLRYNFKLVEDEIQCIEEL